MVSYTTQIDDHDAARLKLRRREAEEMEALGFRFAEYNPEYERFRLSIPYETLRDLDRGTLTFMQ